MPPIASAAEAPAKPATEPIPDMNRRAYARAVRRMIVLLVAVGIASRVVRLFLPIAVWGDETMLGLNFLNRDYAGLTRALDNAQVAPILFLWSQKFMIDSFGMSEKIIRLLPLLAGIAGLIFFWDFARRAVPPTAAVLAVGLMAVSVTPVTMATNMKPYAGDMCWSALLMALAVRWYNRPARLWPLAALAAVVPLAIGMSYPVVFVAGGVGIYLLPLAWRGGRPARLLFAAYGLSLLVSFGTVYLLVGRAQVDPATGNTGEFMQSYWRPGFPPDSLSDVPLWLLDRHTNRGFAYPIGDNHGVSTGTLLYFLGGIWWCWRNGSRPLLVLCLVPFALNMVAAVLGKYPYTGCSRLSQHMAPAICLLVGVGWASLLAWFAPRLADRLVWVRWAVGILLVFLVGCLITRSLSLHHDRTAEFSQYLYRQLNAVCRAEDRIVYPSTGLHDSPMRWHFARLGDRVVVLPPGERPPPAARVWAITSTFGRPDEAAHRRFIESLSLTGYQVGFTTWFLHCPPFVQGGEAPLWCYAVTCLSPPGDPGPAPLRTNP